MLIIVLCAHRTKRTWHPNVQKKKYYSDILDTTINIRLTTAAMRCIDKAGGFDGYIYHTPEKKLQSRLGMALKQRMREVVKKFGLKPPEKVVRLPHQARYLDNVDDSSSVQNNASNIKSTSTE